MDEGYKDHPFEEIVKAVEAKIKQGVDCFQKFTCENCGSRQTIDEPNVFYTEGICEECKHTTSMLKRGCNYMAIFSITPEGKEAVASAIKEITQGEIKDKEDKPDEDIPH